MASTVQTTCPKCGGRAEWHTDDGVTYCEVEDCRWFGIPEGEAGKYQPPWHRGGSDFGGRAA